jgi:hypothetical protein
MIKMVLAIGASTLVERLATDPEIKGSYPATAWHKDKMAERMFWPRPWPVVLAQW